MHSLEIPAVVETTLEKPLKPLEQQTKTAGSDFLGILTKLTGGNAVPEDEKDTEISGKGERKDKEKWLSKGLEALCIDSSIGIPIGENPIGLQSEGIEKVQPFDFCTIDMITSKDILPLAVEETSDYPLEEILSGDIASEEAEGESHGPWDHTFVEELEIALSEQRKISVEEPGTSTPKDCGVSTEDEKTLQDSPGSGANSGIIPEGKSNIEKNVPQEHGFTGNISKDSTVINKSGNTSVKHAAQRNESRFESIEEKTLKSFEKDVPTTSITEPDNAHRSYELRSPRNDAGTARTDIVNQIAEKMKAIFTQKRSEVTIQLKPESLGRLKVSLIVTDGVLNGRVIVQNSETRDLLRANIQRLQENLEQHGISLGKFHVNMGGGYNQQQFTGNFKQNFHGRQNLETYREEEKKEFMFLRGEGTIELLA